MNKEKINLGQIEHIIPFRIWELNSGGEVIGIASNSKDKALLYYEDMIGYKFEEGEYTIEECDYKKGMYYEFMTQEEYNEYNNDRCKLHPDKKPVEGGYKRVWRQIIDVLLEFEELGESFIFYQTIC